MDRSNLEISQMLLVSGNGQVADLKQDFNNFEMTEDITLNTVSAFLSFSETESIRETFPIIGEEMVFLRYRSITNPAKPDPEVEIVFNVIKMINFTIDGDKKRSYGLILNTVDHRLNFTKRIRKSYSGNTSSIVQRISDGMLQSNVVDIDPDKFTNNYIFPNWRPFQAINFLSSNAISEKYNDPYYMFYQDRLGFHYVSLSCMMDRTQGLIIDQKILNISGTDTTEKNVQSFTNDKMFDTDENVLTGMYGSTLISYDKISKSYKETVRTYTDSFSQFTHVGEQKLTVNFPESPKFNFQFMMDNSIENPGVYNFVDDIHKERIIRGNQHRNNIWEITYTADTGILIGNYCTFNLKSPLTETLDKKLSGKYLIKAIKTRMTPDNLYMYITICKDGVFS